MKADPAVERQVNAVLSSMAAAYQKKDIPALMSLYAVDADVVLIGPTKQERLIGPVAIRRGHERDFAASGPVMIEFTWTTISARISVAWVAAECLLLAAAHPEKGPVFSRLTLVLELRDRRWMIVQQHLSLPMAA